MSVCVCLCVRECECVCVCVSVCVCVCVCGTRSRRAGYLSSPLSLSVLCVQDQEGKYQTLIVSR